MWAIECCDGCNRQKEKLGAGAMTSRSVKRYIRKALGAGEIADCRQFSVKDRKVDASFLRELILGGLPSGMRVVGLTINGMLDLSDCGSVSSPLPALRLERCNIITPLTDGASHPVSLDLSRSHVASLSLQGSRFTSFCGRGMVCRAEVDLSDVSAVDERGLCWIDMSNAVVGGNLVAVGARFQSELIEPLDKGERAICTGLVLQEARIAGTVNLYKSEVIGGLSLYLAQVKGDLWLGQCRLMANGGWSLDASDAEIGAIYATREPLVADASLVLNGARIRSRINLEKAKINAMKTIAVSLRAAHIGESLSLSNADLGGYLDLAGMRCGDDVRLLGTSITDTDRDAIRANEAQIYGSLYLSAHPDSKRRFHAEGWITLNGCHIHNDLIICGADLHGKFEEVDQRDDKQYHSALLADDLRVGGCIKFGQKSKLQEERRSLFSAGALRMERVEVGKDIQLFNAKVVGTPIKKNTQDTDETNSPHSPLDNVAFDLSYSKVGGILIIGDNDLTGSVNLYCTSTDFLWDNRFGYQWPKDDEGGDVQLVGFTYRMLMSPDMEDDDDIADLRNTVRVRKEWLERSKYDAQDYATLARALRRSALTDEAREIMIARFCRELTILASGVLSRRIVPESSENEKDWPSKQSANEAEERPIWSRAESVAVNLPRYLLAQVSDLSKYLLMQIYRATFGFGLDPRRATLTLAVFFLLGWGIFALANDRDLMIVDQQPVATLSDRSAIGAGLTDVVASNVPCGDMIDSGLFALDVFIPLVDLRQESKCEIGVAADSSATASQAAWLKVFKVTYAIFGWIVTSLSILTFSGFLQRRNELHGGDA